MYVSVRLVWLIRQSDKNEKYKWEYIQKPLTTKNNIFLLWNIMKTESFIETHFIHTAPAHAILCIDFFVHFNFGAGSIFAIYYCCCWCYYYYYYFVSFLHRCDFFLFLFLFGLFWFFFFKLLLSVDDLCTHWGTIDWKHIHTKNCWKIEKSIATCQGRKQSQQSYIDLFKFVYPHSSTNRKRENQNGFGVNQRTGKNKIDHEFKKIAH